MNIDNLNCTLYGLRCVCVTPNHVINRRIEVSFHADDLTSDVLPGLLATIGLVRTGELKVALVAGGESELSIELSADGATHRAAGRCKGIRLAYGAGSEDEDAAVRALVTLDVPYSPELLVALAGLQRTLVTLHCEPVQVTLPHLGPPPPAVSAPRKRGRPRKERPQRCDEGPIAFSGPGIQTVATHEIVQ